MQETLYQEKDDLMKKCSQKCSWVKETPDVLDAKMCVLQNIFRNILNFIEIK